MPTVQLTKAQAIEMGLVKGVEKPRRISPHVAEIMAAVKKARAGMFYVYRPDPQETVTWSALESRIKSAFDALGKPWPSIRRIEGGKAAAFEILSRTESLTRYTKQRLAVADANKKLAEEAQTPKAKRSKSSPIVKPLAVSGTNGKNKKRGAARTTV